MEAKGLQQNYYTIYKQQYYHQYRPTEENRRAHVTTYPHNPTWSKRLKAKHNIIYHRLRGSASRVLTATHHSYGSPRLSDFFSPLGSGGQTPQRTFTQNCSNDVFSRKDVPFAVKVATFHTP